MIGRVTQQTMVQNLLGQVGTLQRRLVDSQAQLSSQKRLLRPSDDPSGSAESRRLRSDAQDLRTLRETVGFGTTVLGAQDSALEQAGSLLLRAREIATRMSTELQAPADRQQAAQEVAELERTLLSLGNTTVSGRYVFGGLQSDPPPFAQLDDPGFTPATAYSGPAERFFIRSGPDTATTPVSTPGDQVFGDAIQVLDDLRQTLEAGDSPVGLIEDIDDASSTVRLERVSVGGRSRRLLDRTQEILAGIQTNSERIGRVEDADFTEVVVELTQLQQALQATLQSGQVLQTSILDSLRL